MRRRAACLALVLSAAFVAGCSSTAALDERQLPVPARAAPATPQALGEIVVSSRSGDFGSGSERDRLRDGLRTALIASNLFGGDRSRPYRLEVTVLDFDIPLFDKGLFESMLVMRYELFDAGGTKVYGTTLQSFGRDDTHAFLGATRKNRSRTVVVAENLYTFVRRLEQHLDPKRKPLFAP